MNRVKRFYALARAFSSYVRRQAVFSYLPVRFWIEPTNICNLRCVMCPNSAPRPIKRGYMDADLFYRIIDEIKSFAHNMNIHHRGESLLHRQLPEFVHYARQHGLVVRLHTNATLLDEEMSRKLIESGLSFISFSFDGYEKAEYESVRVRADFDRTLANIIRFLRLKQKLGTGKPETVIEVMELSRHTSGKQGRLREAFRRRFANLPLDRFIIKPPHNWAGSYGDVINERSRERTGNGKFVPCTFPWFALVIFWDGTVVSCPQDFYGEYVLGNVTEKSIRDIWRDEPMLNLRRKMISQDVSSFVACRDCDQLKRKTILRIPRSNLKGFLKENV